MEVTAFYKVVMESRNGWLSGVLVKLGKWKLQKAVGSRAIQYEIQLGFLTGSY
jgi:hypothetical protein